MIMQLKDIKKDKYNMTMSVKNPCKGCIYYKVCGSYTRTMPCEGRVTKSQKKKELKNDR